MRQPCDNERVRRRIVLVLLVCVAGACTELTCPPATEVAPQMSLLVTALISDGADVVLTARTANVPGGAVAVSKSGAPVVSMPGTVPGTITLRVSANEEVWLERGENQSNHVTVRDRKVTVGRPALSVFASAKNQIWVIGAPSTNEFHFYDGRNRNIDSLVDCEKPEAQWLVDFVVQCSVAQFKLSRLRVVTELDGHRVKSTYAVIR